MKKLEVEKVKLPKDYFNAMEKLDKRTPFKTLIRTQVNRAFIHSDIKILNDLDTVIFVNALQYGYELKVSPKELVENKYHEIIKIMTDDVLPDNNWYELRGKKLAMEDLNEILKLGLNLNDGDE